MQLKDIQQVLSQAEGYPPSAREALRELKASVDRALTHLEEGNTVSVQSLLEHGFTNLMVAFHYLNINLENVVSREQHRQREARLAQERVILVFADHAELRVQGELRGTIPLYSEEDYAELRQIAQLFQCRIEYADHIQLTLFSALASS